MFGIDGQDATRSIAHLYQMLTQVSISETAIWSLVWDDFGTKGQDVDPRTAL